jgi:HSP20 family protein
MQEKIDDVFMGINDQGLKEQMEEYEILKDVGIREFSSFVYGYSMTMEYKPDKPRIRKIRNEGVDNSGNTRKRQGVSKYNKQHTTSERESLAEVNIYDKEVKVVLEMPGASKDRIKIRAYDNLVEIFSDHPETRHRVINIPHVADIETIRATYKNGILEIIFKKKQKKRN